MDSSNSPLESLASSRMILVELTNPRSQEHHRPSVADLSHQTCSVNLSLELVLLEWRRASGMTQG